MENSDSWKNCCNNPKIEQHCFTLQTNSIVLPYSNSIVTLQ